MTRRIVVFGATSGIGRCAVEEALSRGHSVRAFARGAASLEARPRLEPMAGDALKAEDVAAALEGVDVIIYALGIKEGLSMLWQEVTLFSRSTEVLLEEMPKAGVRRLLVVTGFGAGRSKSAMSRIERMGHRAVLGKPYEDKDRQEEMLVASDLDWTIARPVILTNGAQSGRYKALGDPDTWRNGLISRADVACYLLDAIENDEDIRRDVVLSR